MAGSDYLPMHFWPSPSIFAFIAIFFLSPCPAIFGAPFRICCVKILFAWKSLSQQKMKSKSLTWQNFKSNWFVNPLPHYFHHFRWVAVVVVDAGGVDGRFRCGAGSIGWVAVAVADAGGVDGWFCCRTGSFWMGGSGCGQCWGSGSGRPVLLQLW
jgi:hypothetical protein